MLISIMRKSQKAKSCHQFVVPVRHRHTAPINPQVPYFLFECQNALFIHWKFVPNDVQPRLQWIRDKDMHRDIDMGGSSSYSTYLEKLYF